MEQIRFDRNRKYGAFKPLNGVNGAPIHTPKYSVIQQMSTLDAWQKAGIPFARAHDAAYFIPYGMKHAVDISGIYPDFDADPMDPASYDFNATDIYIEMTIEGGSEPFYRLGEVFDVGKKAYYTKPPKDFHKFAVICEHIIRHYTEGWGNGFHYNMRYWEIWNEPDLGTDFWRENSLQAWGGTAEQYFDLYEITAKHLKACFPKLRIGGPAAAANPGETFCEDFLKEMSRRNAPLDFFSWHNYGASPAALMAEAEMFRSLLDRYGFTEAENILDEWNYMHDQTVYFTDSLAQIHGIKGAAYVMACMSAAQQAPLDKMMYYCAEPYYYNGMFDYYTLRPLKGYYPFVWFSEFKELTELRAENRIDDIYTLCGIDRDGKIKAVVTYYTDEDNMPEKELSFDFGKEGRYTLTLLDEDTTCEVVATSARPQFTLRPNSCLFIQEVSEQ